MEIKFSPNTFARVWRDGPWVILYIEDDGGGKTTISLNPSQAIDLATLLNGAGISAAGVEK